MTDDTESIYRMAKLSELLAKKVDIARIGRVTEVRILAPTADRGHRPLTDPETFLTWANHYVVWQCDDPFSIVFDQPRPNVGDHVLVSQYHAKRGKHFAFARMRPDAGSGRSYKYTLTVALGAEEDRWPRVFTTDPIGNVDPDPRKL